MTDGGITTHDAALFAFLCGLVAGCTKLLLYVAKRWFDYKILQLKDHLRETREKRNGAPRSRGHGRREED